MTAIRFLLPFLLLAVSARAQDMADVRITAKQVAPGIHVLEGRGGNIGVCSGKDGVFLIDDQFAPLTEKITAAVREIGGGEIRFLVNTHFHGDHTGGNENLGRAGVLIVAHDNVRERLGTEQVNKLFDRTTPPSPEGALPVVTFNDAVTFHLNGETIRVFHVDNAHTDGDAVVHFVKADVVHAGDVYFNGLYPFIDTSAGGSIDGTLAAADRILQIAGPGTRIIPGHGEVTGRDGLLAYRDMLATVRRNVKQLLDAGKNLEEIQAAKPTADFDAEWGDGFLDPDTFTKAVAWSLGGE